MENLIQQLKSLRESESQLKESLAKLQDKLEQTTEWEALQFVNDGLVGLQKQIKVVDEGIRQAALDYYTETGDKHPHPKVSVIINKELTYDVKRAIGWAINNALGMLKLDTAKFEKHARAVADTVPVEFVEINDKPSVRIASEL